MEENATLPVDESTVTITRLDTGEIIAINQIDPERDYWRNILRPASGWPR